MRARLTFTLTTVYFLTIVSLFAEALFAEELQSIFQRVEKFSNEKNYTKAMEELGWARKELEKLHMVRLKEFFPEELSGFKGAKVELNNALGFTSVERNYLNTGDSKKVKISLTGGSQGGAAGLGGLAQLGRMAAMMQGQTGQDTFRIAGRTSTLTLRDGSNEAELTVFLDSGSILKLEMDNGKDGELLKSMASTLKLDELDSYLKG